MPEAKKNVPPPPPPGLLLGILPKGPSGIPLPPPGLLPGLGGIPPPPNLLSQIAPPPAALLGLLGQKQGKSSRDPRPKNAGLRKVFVGALAPAALTKTFWSEHQDKLFKEESIITLDWGALETDFKEKESKKIEGDKNTKDKSQGKTREGILEDKKVNQFEIILSRFSLTLAQTREALQSLKITQDQAAQVMILLPEEEVIFSDAGLQADS